MHAFLRAKQFTAVTGTHLVRPPPAPAEDDRGPRALSSNWDWGLWRVEWAKWLTRLLPECQLMATGP